MKKKSSEFPVIIFVDQQSLENWLENNHDTSPGIRLQIAKKNSGVVSVSYDEALG